MKSKLVCLFITILIFTNSQVISEVDFIRGSVNTGSVMWDNIIGLSLDILNIENLMNTTLYQGFHLNSNVMGDWRNNFAVSIKVPLGHKFNCSVLVTNPINPNISCTFQTQGNLTYWSRLGTFIWNTVNQPNWCMGYDMQGVNLSLPAHQQTFFNWILQVFRATFNALYCAQLVDYGDKMVQRGYKSSYTPANFVRDIEIANMIVSTIGHSGPGITEDASKDWLLSIQNFTKVARRGHFTVRCVVFKDPANVTIQNILSDNATKYYLLERFRINSTFAYTDFTKLPMGINDIKLTVGDGVDGVTNTFAAALWAVDMVLEFALLNGGQIHFNHEVREGNFQSILSPLPGLKPTPIYYGLLFAAMIRNGAPKIILPSTKALISSKIKAYGLTTGDVFKIVLLNKDTNSSLNGRVLVKSQLTGALKCIYLQAPSLSSKDGINIAGYNFEGGNSNVKGIFTQKKIQYDYPLGGYSIPIKYAQAVLCETADSIFNWPRGTDNKYGMRTFSTFLFSLILLFAVLL